MAAFRRFEDILAWQKARTLNQIVYSATTQGDFSRDFDLRSQIRRASTSIMANIAEGFGRHSDRDFAHFLNIAYASACEVQSHLYVALDLNYLTDKTRFDEIYSLADEICRMVFSLRQKLIGSQTVDSRLPTPH